MLGAGVFLTGHPAFGVLTLAADFVTFLATLVLYKVACYSYCVRCRPRPFGGLRRLLLASLLFGPLSMAVVLAARHPAADWGGRRGLALALLVVLAAGVRPTVVLFTTFSRRGSFARWFVSEWGKRAVGTLVGSAVLAAVALAVFQAEVDQSDLAFDAGLYLAFVTATVAWRSRSRVADPPPPPRATPGTSGCSSSATPSSWAHISVLAPLLHHRLTIAGALLPRGGGRTSTVGGVPILGEPVNAPHVVQALGVTRVVVVGPTLGAAALSRLHRTDCNLRDDQITQVEFPGLPPRLWRRDVAETSS